MHLGCCQKFTKTVLTKTFVVEIEIKGFFCFCFGLSFMCQEMFLLCHFICSPAFAFFIGNISFHFFNNKSIFPFSVTFKILSLTYQTVFAGSALNGHFICWSGKRPSSFPFNWQIIVFQDPVMSVYFSLLITRLLIHLANKIRIFA